MAITVSFKENALTEIKEISGKIVDWKIIDEKNRLSTVKKARPAELFGRTYALKSSLLKSTLYITINNITMENGNERPFEIFFNTRDTGKFIELQIITRLISAIFRRTENAVFVIDELKAVANPENTGYFRGPREEKGETKGIYIPSIFYEIGEIIEEHFISLGFNDPRLKKKVITANNSQALEITSSINDWEIYELEEDESDQEMLINRDVPPEMITGVECPQCHEKTLRKEGGCDVCPLCSYSKCG
jgi:ribonucleoside-diphosphate reductase alpha chain